MRVFDSLEAIPAGEFDRGTAIAIGKFDGVHRGHQALISGISEAARLRGLDPLVFTFANHPLSVLRPDIYSTPLMSRQQRLDAFEAAGVATCVMPPFDERFASISAEQFIEHILVGALNVQHLCVGRDFRFGQGGAGTDALLNKQQERFGYTVEIIEQITDDELGRVSSSRIRNSILHGDVAEASRMLGRPVTVRGEVVHGDARGRELGFPTANLGDRAASGDLEGLVPADGVYAGWAVVDGIRHRAAISIGVNLTFEPEGTPRVEANLLDFEGDLYGKRIEVQFVERLRGMVAFPSVEALVERIHEDVRQTRAILAGS